KRSCSTSSPRPTTTRRPCTNMRRCKPSATAPPAESQSKLTQATTGIWTRCPAAPCPANAGSAPARYDLGNVAQAGFCRMGGTSALTDGDFWPSSMLAEVAQVDRCEAGCGAAPGVPDHRLPGGRSSFPRERAVGERSADEP